MADTPVLTLDPWQTLTGVSFNRGNILRIMLTAEGTYDTWNYTPWRVGIFMSSPRRGLPVCNWLYPMSDPAIPDSIGLSKYATTPVNYISDLYKSKYLLSDDPWGSFGIKYGFGWFTGYDRDYTYGADMSDFRAVGLYNLDGMFAEFPETKQFEFQVVASYSLYPFFYEGTGNSRCDVTWWRGCTPRQMYCPERQKIPGIGDMGELGVIPFFTAGKQVVRKYLERRPGPWKFVDIEAGTDINEACWNGTRDLLYRVIVNRETGDIEFSTNKTGAQRSTPQTVTKTVETYYPSSTAQHRGVTGGSLGGYGIPFP